MWKFTNIRFFASNFIQKLNFLYIPTISLKILSSENFCFETFKISILFLLSKSKIFQNYKGFNLYNHMDQKYWNAFKIPPTIADLFWASKIKIFNSTYYLDLFSNKICWMSKYHSWLKIITELYHSGLLDK